MSVFPRFAQRRSTWRGPGSDEVSVLLRTEEATVFGVGSSRGGAVTEALITGHLRQLLLGQDSLEVIRRTQEMRRAVAPYAAGGVGSMAVSAVEQALWDLTARAHGVPLYRLLGGAAGSLPSYLTCASPELVSNLADTYDPPIVKIPMPYGPADGDAGLARNVELVATARQAWPGSRIAVDCFMSWDEVYTRRFASATAGYDLAWIEEPLPAGETDAYRRLRGRLGDTALAAGEHIFGLEAGLRFLAADCVDVVQFDVSWCGGVHTSMILAEVTEASGRLFAPHAAGLQPWATHLLAACGPSVLAEVLHGVDGGPVTWPVRPSDTPGVGVDPAALGFGR
jgi:L-rhamnonate dehydratase